MVNSERAFEADQAGEPIIISAKAARELVEDHTQEWTEFVRYMGRRESAAVNAWTVYEWLGY